MDSKELIGDIQAAYKFFLRSTDCLSEHDSQFAPVDGVFTVSQQVAHVAQTIDWFIDGAFLNESFDTDFDKHVLEIRQIQSLNEAKEWLRKSIERAINVLTSFSEQELEESLPEGPVMSEVPRYKVVGAIVEHMAHHRGALTVYSRLLGKVPEMPYGEN